MADRATGLPRSQVARWCLPPPTVIPAPQLSAPARCNATPPPLWAAAPLTINSGGAKANLNYTGNKAIASLTLGGEAQADGSYGSLTSDASFKSAYFQGTGTVTVGDPATFASITSFGANVPGSSAAIGAVAANAADIDFYVPAGTNLATLAPEFVLSPGATCSDQTSGAIPSPGFDAGTVDYTVVSQDMTVTNFYTVAVTVLPVESTVLWDLPVDGDWNYTTANWKGQSSGLPVLFLDGADVIFDKAIGGLITVAVPLGVTVSPGDMTVNPPAGTTYRWAGGKGNIGGAGTLTKSGDGVLRIGQSDTGPTIPMLNTFSGGTIINGGELRLEPTSNTGLGTGPVTLNTGTLPTGADHCRERPDGQRRFDLFLERLWQQLERSCYPEFQPDHPECKQCQVDLQR